MQFDFQEEESIFKKFNNNFLQLSPQQSPILNSIFSPVLSYSQKYSKNEMQCDEEIFNPNLNNNLEQQLQDNQNEQQHIGYKTLYSSENGFFDQCINLVNIQFDKCDILNYLHQIIPTKWNIDPTKSMRSDFRTLFYMFQYQEFIEFPRRMINKLFEVSTLRISKKLKNIYKFQKSPEIYIWSIVIKIEPQSNSSQFLYLFFFSSCTPIKKNDWNSIIQEINNVFKNPINSQMMRLQIKQKKTTEQLPQDDKLFYIKDTLGIPPLSKLLQYAWKIIQADSQNYQNHILSKITNPQIQFSSGFIGGYNYIHKKDQLKNGNEQKTPFEQSVQFMIPGQSLIIDYSPGVMTINQHILLELKKKMMDLRKIENYDLFIKEYLNSNEDFIINEFKKWFEHNIKLFT